MTNNQKLLIHWITERWNIKKLKDVNAPKPWSTDPAMQSVRYCNVNREDDTVTKWIRKNWTYPTATNEWEDDTLKSYTFSMIVARLFNNPETLAELMQPVDHDSDLSYWFENATETLNDMRDRSEKIWNGAYIISTNGKKMPKVDYCLDILKNIAKHKNLIDNCKTLSEAHNVLMGLEGLGSFLAGQIICDLKNTHGHPLSHAPDWFTFSSHGPGSLRGLSWFWEEKINPAAYSKAIHDAHEMVQWELPEEILEILCYQNLQNCFCEYDKYMRVTSGTGKAKQKYPGV